MLRFLFSKTFLINLVLAFIFLGGLVFGILRYLDDYTNHGNSISVPSLEGLKLTEVSEILNEKKLRFSILDSIYISGKEKETVLEQNPWAGDLVKENRTIYITTSKVVPPKKQIPQGIIGNSSARIAIAKLESLGFRIGKLSYIPSADNNVVLRMDIDEKEITNGDLIFESSIINLTIGGGLSQEKIMVPNLLSLTKEEATDLLHKSFLNVGFSNYENCQCETTDDTLNAKIYRHSPKHSQNIVVNMGGTVDLYFTCDTSLIQPILPIDTLQTDTTKNE